MSLPKSARQNPNPSNADLETCGLHWSSGHRSKTLVFLSCQIIFKFTNVSQDRFTCRTQWHGQWGDSHTLNVFPSSGSCSTQFGHIHTSVWNFFGVSEEDMKLSICNTWTSKTKWLCWYSLVFNVLYNISMNHKRKQSSNKKPHSYVSFNVCCFAACSFVWVIWINSYSVECLFVSTVTFCPDDINKWLLLAFYPLFI